MSGEDNRLRRKWQDYSGKSAGKAEQDFYQAFKSFFEDSKYKIRSKPKEFNKIYIGVALTDKELSEIYTPDEPITHHGVFPDYAIDNTETGKTIYIEVKRQDGWVEGGKRSDGRGNAHERSCKFFTPGLLKILRKHGKIADANLPFWTVFQGNITRDPCRVREITCWYGDEKGHFFFWRDATNAIPLTEHFIEYLAPIID